MSHQSKIRKAYKVYMRDLYGEHPHHFKRQDRDQFSDYTDRLEELGL